MTIQTIIKTDKIIKTLDSSSAGEVLELFDYVPFTKLGYRVVSESIRLENIQLKTFINSIPVSPFPAFSLDLSNSEMQLEALKLEWESPRIQLNLLIKNTGTSWMRIGMASIRNPSPAPYSEYDLGSHELGNTAMIGLQIQNAGWGLLQGADRVNVFSDLRRTINIEKISEGTKYDYTLNAVTPTQVLPSNAERLGFTIFNRSITDVFLDLTSDVSSTSALVKVPAMGYWESNFNITDAIFMIALDGTAAVSIREFVG